MPAEAEQQPDSAQGGGPARPESAGSKAIDRLLKSLKVQPAEKRLALRLAAIFAVIQSSQGLGANTADALFFSRFGVERLPVMILLSGPAVMVVTVLHATGLAVRGVRSWLWMVAAGSAAVPALGWLAITLVDARPVYAVIWVVNQVIIMLTFTVAWNAAGSACTTRQAKRLFPLFATAGVGGGVVGNLLTGPLASTIGTASVLLVQASLLVAGAAGIRACRPLFHVEESRPRAAGEELRAGFDVVRRTPLMQMTAWVAFATSLLWFLVVFPFSDAVANSFESEAEMAGFLGLFSSAATAATFLVSLLITNRLFARFGVVLSFLAVPVVYLVGFSWWLVDFDLAAAATVRALQWVAVNAIGGTAFTAFFNVLTGERRGQVMAFITAVPSQLGTMASGLILLVGGAFFPASVRFTGGLILAAGATALVLRMRSAYVAAIVTAVRRGLVGVFNVPAAGVVTPVDAVTRRVLESHLDDQRPEARAVAVTGLSRISGGDAGRIERFMHDDSPVVRAAAFDSMCVIDPDRIGNHVAGALADPDPEVRLRAIRYLEADGRSGEAEAALVDSDLRVRTAAALLVGGEHARAAVQAALHEGTERGLVVLLEESARTAARSTLVDPVPLLAHSSSRVRVAASNHPAVASDPSVLVAALDDASPRVRHAAARALAGTEEGHGLLLEVLEMGSVSASDSALRALVAVTGFDAGLAEWAGREARRAAYLRSAAAAIPLDGTASTGRFLVRMLERRSARLVDWVLLATTTAESRPMMAVVERGIRSNDPETRGQALEALESIGERSIALVLLPLLEDGGGSEADPRILRTLADDFDPWIRALAVRCMVERIEDDLEELSHRAREDRSPLVREAVPSFVHMTADRLDTLGTVERVLALQRVPMFADLDPEDLELIARNLSEVHFDRGALVFRDGEPGDEMLLIVRGSAVVSKLGGDSRYVINTYGEGDHVGELALLGGGPRSADVHAGDQGMEGLTLGKADLLSILDERPAAAVGMLGTLARRLVEQT